MGGATSGLIILASIGKQTEQAMESKPVSSTPLQLLHHILCPGSYPDFLQ